MPWITCRTKHVCNRAMNARYWGPAHHSTLFPSCFFVAILPDCLRVPSCSLTRRTTMTRWCRAWT